MEKLSSRAISPEDPTISPVRLDPGVVAYLRLFVASMTFMPCFMSLGIAVVVLAATEVTGGGTAAGTSLFGTSSPDSFLANSSLNVLVNFCAKNEASQKRKAIHRSQDASLTCNFCASS
jgi:hypothetical protein